MTSIPTGAASAFRTAIVTGGNTGLGLECARALMHDSEEGAPWRVILACRDAARARVAVDDLNAEATAAGRRSRAEAGALDLAALSSVRAFATGIAARIEAGEFASLDAVVCNAGVQAGATQTQTADGFETTFGVNHLAHFLLIEALRSVMSPHVRIAVVASGVHDPAQKTGIPIPAWNEPVALARGELGPLGAKDAPGIGGRRRYSTSKLANVYFTYELAKRLPPGATANAFDPGLMPGTGLAREAPPAFRWVWKNVLPRALPLVRRFILANTHTPAESGAALARLVTAPELATVTGRYFEGRREIRSSDESYDTVRASELWAASEVLTAQLTAEPPPAGSELKLPWP